MMAVLLLPKLLTVLLFLRDRSRSAGFGGRLKFARSVLMEICASTLLAPNLALLQARFVTGILLGGSVRWEAQDRGDAGTPFREAVRRHWPSTLIGLGWSVLLLTTVPKLLWWFSPVILGFVLAIPISAWSSQTGLGEWARRRGWFVIPEEQAPPEILRRLEEALTQAERKVWAPEADGLARVLEDPQTRAVHLSLLSAPATPGDDLKQHYLQGLELKFRRGGLTALTRQEKRDLLLDPDFLLAAGSESPMHSSASRR